MKMFVKENCFRHAWNRATAIPLALDNG